MPEVVVDFFEVINIAKQDAERPVISCELTDAGLKLHLAETTVADLG